MTKYGELIKRLREYREFSEGSSGACWYEVEECLEAAAAIEALEAKLAAVEEGSRMAAAALGDELARLEKPVRVKPLEWERVDHREYEAVTEIGRYSVIRTICDVAVLRFDGEEIRRRSDRGFEQSFAAAQADYERRILLGIERRVLSAIKIAQSGTQAAVAAALEKAAEEFSHPETYLVARRIRALIEPTGPAALGTMLAEARAEGWRAGQEDMLERAAMICREAIFDDPIYGTERFCNRALTKCEVKIRALPIKEAKK